MDTVLMLSAFVSLATFLKAAFSYARYYSARRRLLSYLKIWEVFDQAAASVPSSLISRIFWHLADSCHPLGRRFPFPDTFEEIQTQLERSGRTLNLTVERFLGLKILLTGIGLGVGWLDFQLGSVWSNLGLVLFPVLGFFAPVFWLRKSARDRQRQISRDLPDFLDIMSVTLQAGAALDQAVQQTVKIVTGPLREELERVYYEMELGVEREEALLRLTKRNSTPELRKLVNSLLQGSRLGVPVSSVFRMQAADMRKLRMEQIKQKAAKASPKVTIFTTLVMAPAVFILILGLLILNVVYNPDGLGISQYFYD